MKREGQLERYLREGNAFTSDDGVDWFTSSHRINVPLDYNIQPFIFM
jgi:hypothetical protein